LIAHGFFGPFGFSFLIALLIAIWVASDANKRGMNGVAWAIGVFLLCIVFLPIYLIVRKPILTQQQPFGYPPPSGTPTPGFCSNCGSPLGAGVRFCAKCGKPA
jgi:hypothetical protein